MVSGGAFFISFFVASLAAACGLEGQEGLDTAKPKVHSFALQDVGRAHFIIEAPGCPESSPLRLTLAADCGEKELQLPIDGVAACAVEEMDWRPQSGVLLVNYFAPGKNCPGVKAQDTLKTIKLNLNEICQRT